MSAFDTVLLDFLSIAFNLCGGEAEVEGGEGGIVSSFLTLLICANLSAHGLCTAGAPRMAPGLVAKTTSFELASLSMSGLDMFIRTNLVLVQHWELLWHQVNGATMLEGRNSVSLL